MKWLYSFFVFLMKTSFWLLSFFDQKIKKGWDGRKRSLEIVQSKISKDDKVLWMHTASLGEYEQGLPVLEKLKEQHPHHKVLITFFSPSGYENVSKKNTEDILCYLPFDTKREISTFVRTVHPEIFFTVKYDFWYHLFAELKSIKTKTFVVSALFYQKQIYCKPFGKWFVNQLKKNVDWFFHQTKHSYDLAMQIGLSQSSISGDTRFDRVKAIASQKAIVPLIDVFKGEDSLIVFGSSWEAEEKIAQAITSQSKNWKIIIAPHDLKRVEHLKKTFPKAAFYSEIVKSQNRKSDNETISPFHDFTTLPILIIDCIGLLSKIYSYADVAIVGGGFHDKGLHNILEAATYGKPVFFGNHYKKNPEADGLIAHGGAKAFHNENDAIKAILDIMENKSLIQKMGEMAKDFVHSQPDSSTIILQKIQELVK